MAIPTNANQVQAFAGAMYGVQIGTVTMAQVTSDIQAAGGLIKALNMYYVASFGSATTASVAASFAANLGLTGAALSEGTNYVTARLNAVPANERGAVIVDILNLFAGLASDATYGAAATAWNAKVNAAEGYAGTSNLTFGSNVGQGANFALTVGIDSGAAFVGGSGNDTFAGSTSAGALTLSSLDAIDGGAGNDTLTIAATVPVNTTSMVGATVKNIETVTITSTGAVTANTTAWTGVTGLTTASTGNATLTAAATTDIAATAAEPTGAGAALINGGKSVTLNVTDTSVANTATNNTVVVGTTTAAAGAVTITQSETHAASTDGAATALATGTIRVDGGTTVTVNSLAAGGAGDNAGDILTIGQVTVKGKGTVTNVSVTQSAATVAYAAAGDLYKITNGVVDITDNNTATKTDTITTVSLANFGNSTIVGNALTTLNLTGGSAAATASGTVGISQSASVKTAAPTALAINMTSGRVGVITDTNDQYTTLDVVSAAAATIGGLDFTNATTLNVSGAGVTTISAQTDLGKVTAINSTGGGLALSGTLATGTAFTGGAGKESVDVGATTKAIATGAGDDKVTISATALGTAGSVDAGDGVDTLSMTAANAITASAGTSFETAIAGFEKLDLGNAAAGGAINLSNLDDLNDVAIAGTVAALTLSGAITGINLRFADAVQTSTIVTLANSGSADVANVFLTTADNASTHTAIDLTGFETLNIATADTDTDTVLASNTITGLTAGDATTVVVTGNAGLALAAGFAGTKVTSFDASGVTAGAVTYTTGALVSAATIKGGAGADTLSAASATKAVTINGGAGNDGITGSSTKGSTLNGDAGNDVITGGAAADVVDGGAGTDTFVANNAEQAGASNVTGAVVNLSDAALSQSAVFAATGKYLTSAAPSIAAGSATYLFSGESTTNDSVVDTLANIENVTGTATADYIVGSSADNVITGAAGADVLTGGAGADTFAFGIADSVASNANLLTGAGIAALDTVTFGAGVDFITDFVAGTDKLDLTTAAAAPTTLFGVATATALTAGTSYVAYGTYNASTGVFTIAAAFNATTAKDALVIADGNGLTAVTTTGVVVIDNLTAALASTDII